VSSSWDCRAGSELSAAAVAAGRAVVGAVVVGAAAGAAASPARLRRSARSAITPAAPAPARNMMNQRSSRETLKLNAELKLNAGGGAREFEL